MIELLATDRTDIVAYRIEGKVTEADFDAVAEAIEAALDEHAHVHLYAELISIAGMEPGALVNDIKFGVKHIGDYGRFKRVAVVSDEGWIRMLASAEGLIPGITVRTFKMAEREQGMAWLEAGGDA